MASAITDLTTAEKNLSKIATCFFAIAFSCAFFDTLSYWSIIFPQHHEPITFFVIHLHIINLLLMLAEALWSLMLIPIIQVIWVLVAGIIYGVFFGVYKVVNKQWLYPLSPSYLPNALPPEVSIAAGTILLFALSFFLAYGLVRLRNRLYVHGVYHKEDTVHILDTQTF